MHLTLTIIRPTVLAPNQAAEFRFNERGGSIGRKSNNDFILLDPECFISGTHAIIEHHKDGYFLNDLSTNGAFVNNSEIALGQGQSIELKQGDKVTIGDFQLLVSLTQTSAPTLYEKAPADHMPPNDLGSASVDELDNVVFPSMNPNPMLTDTSPAISEFSSVHEQPNSSVDWHIVDDDVETTPVEAPQPSATLESKPSSDDHQTDDEEMPSVLTNRNENNLQHSAVAQQPANFLAPSSSQAPFQQPENPFIDSFLAGAGINAQQLNVKDKHALMEKIGRITRCSIEGLITTLRVRSKIKSSFRVNMTTMSSEENNPLKFSVTTNEALNILLSDDKPEYMPAEKALEEGYTDLQNHQMALMAGMQASIDTIAKQFDPQVLERSFSQHSRPSIIPGQKKAKYWDYYVAFHAKLSPDLQDNLQNTLGESFAQAYEKQINKLL